MTSPGMAVFQPFLRFWIRDLSESVKSVPKYVSTLLEILVDVRNLLRELLRTVSTLLEILGLVCSVLVGF
jgi:hypothetical protein